MQIERTLSWRRQWFKVTSSVLGNMFKYNMRITMVIIIKQLCSCWKLLTLNADLPPSHPDARCTAANTDWLLLQDLSVKGAVSRLAAVWSRTLFVSRASHSSPILLWSLEDTSLSLSVLQCFALFYLSIYSITFNVPRDTRFSSLWWNQSILVVYVLFFVLLRLPNF